MYIVQIWAFFSLISSGQPVGNVDYDELNAFLPQVIRDVFKMDLTNLSWPDVHDVCIH